MITLCRVESQEERRRMRFLARAQGDIECELKLTEILWWRYQKQRLNGTRVEGKQGRMGGLQLGMVCAKMVVALQPSKGVKI